MLRAVAQPPVSVEATHLDLAHSAGDDALQHRPALIVQQVDLIDDDQAHQLRVGAVAALACNDVPLLRRRHDDLQHAGLAQHD